MAKIEGFKNQRTIIIPDYIINEIENDPFKCNLYITDIGYYPDANDHYRSRPKGCPQYILMYCIKGQGWIEFNNKRITIHQNQYFVIPPNTPHNYGCSVNDPWSIYWVHYSGTNAHNFTESLDEANTITPSQVDRIDDRINIFKEIITSLEMGFSKENIGYSSILLGYFLSTFKYIDQFRHIRTTKEGDAIGKSILYMKNNIQNKISLDELAENVALSASYYSSEFKRRTGKSPIDYLTNLRIQEACQLLDHTSLRIKEIAIKIGFDDPFYFSRVFRNIMGVSPKKYKSNPKG
ncbi:AraC family transcriptional regulator [Saccharicrinis aurantiacus]|uniref:AraC family transcriptional regulator n=1 Tax=Saccharicrinis aurantiacus TaxID=1849719 RepID=UPI002493A710|nr:AraC family transcriptional regulator [Saccharicrinis aurantiacus]